MLKRFAVVVLGLSSPCMADVTSVLHRHILPGQAKLIEMTGNLETVAAQDCAPEAVIPAFHDAYDAWISVSHIQFGPIEENALGLFMSFWPDPKDSTGKAIARLAKAKDPIVEDQIGFRQVSAAVQGFTALERLLFETQPDPDYACALVRAVAAGLAEKAIAINAGWPEFSELMQSAGEDGNTRFQTKEEVDRTFYTALSSGLEFLHDQRLGRPLGTFERPRSRRAEARRSERSLRHIELSLNALESLAVSFFDGDLTQTRSAFAKAKERVETLDDPTLAGVADPAKRIRVEALQRTIRDIQNAVNSEIGKSLGITPGFNSLDGD